MLRNTKEKYNLGPSIQKLPEDAAVPVDQADGPSSLYTVPADHRDGSVVLYAVPNGVSTNHHPELGPTGPVILRNMHSPYLSEFSNLMQTHTPACPQTIPGFGLQSPRVASSHHGKGCIRRLRGRGRGGRRVAHTSPLGVAVPVPYHQIKP